MNKIVSRNKDRLIVDCFVFAFYIRDALILKIKLKAVSVVKQKANPWQLFKKYSLLTTFCFPRTEI